MKFAEVVNSLFPSGEILILGNGAAQSPPPREAAVTLTFNGRQPLTRTGINLDVRMTKDVFGKPKLSVFANSERAMPGPIEEHLNQNLSQQALDLGCLPSTGYAVLHGLWDEACDVSIIGIRFDPSLARPGNLPVRKPLPQAFHNWLGERRTTFLRWLNSPCLGWSWPLVKAGVRDDAELPLLAGKRLIDLAEVAGYLEAAAHSGSLAPIQRISQFAIQTGPELLRPSELNRKLEAMFQLDREQSDTRNWWLYDAQASALIEQIAHSIRSAQQFAFSRALESQVKAA
ncbi:hypothetical protein [Paucibacter sp. KBW04]|uniref:hypothetical protein n=1 Tax=Paucibacter sp. KBW04 TaxID=2153361 RepID=UPI000F58006B|nr:hypothetical protein [Paucibacter sp. KBW04]